MATVNQILQTAPDDRHKKGEFGERLATWYFENSPKYSSVVKRVWKFTEWPGRWIEGDFGTDLIVELIDSDKVWAIQAKAYSKNGTVDDTDVRKFLADAERTVVSWRVVFSTTDKISRAAVKHINNDDFIPSYFLGPADLSLENLDWPESIDDTSTLERVLWERLPHQKRAVDDALNGLRREDRGQVLMACGTGKTLTQLWIHEDLGSHLTLVLVPSLYLIGQTIREWTSQQRTQFKYLPVCSDETVRYKDSIKLSESQIGFPSTTRPEKIKEFLSTSGAKVIFSTYDSSHKIAEAIEHVNCTFDLILADEAHHLAGSKQANYVCCLDNKSLPAKKRLFFTATPRLTNKRKNHNDDLAHHSMDGPEFGPVLHSLSFRAAIKAGLLVDYQVLILITENSELQEFLRKHKFTVTKSGLIETGLVAKVYGFFAALRQHHLNRSISFHSTIKSAKQFVDLINQFDKLVDNKWSGRGQLSTATVESSMTVRRRQETLQLLESENNLDYSLVSNARCLGEGVDLPALDGIFFIDPKRSKVDIVQAVGRAIRSSGGKTQGTIVIPVLLDEARGDDATLKNSPYSVIWDVLNALRDHDDFLAEKLDELRMRMGAGEIISLADLPDMLDISFTSSKLRPELFAYISTKLIEGSTSNWEFSFGQMLEFSRTNGHSTPGRSDFGKGGLNLGSWRSNQVSDYNSGRMLPERIARFEKELTNWSWNRDLTEFIRLRDELANYIENHGSLPIQKYITSDGFPLGRRLNSLRMGTINPPKDIHDQLTALGAFEPLLDTDSRYEENCSLVEEYFRSHWTLPSTNDSFDGVNITNWLNTQRQRIKKGTIENWLAARLSPLGLFDASDKLNIVRTEIYLSRHGKLPTAKYVMASPSGSKVQLGAWLYNRKYRGKFSTEDPELLKRFEKLWE